MTIVAIMIVRRSALAAFRRFEHAAAAIMRRHGGAIEHTVVEDDGASPTLREVHLVRFRDAAGFAAYRADPELAALAPVRAEAVVSTDLVIGEPGPTYG